MWNEQRFQAKKRIVNFFFFLTSRLFSIYKNVSRHRLHYYKKEEEEGEKWFHFWNRADKKKSLTLKISNDTNNVVIKRNKWKDVRVMRIIFDILKKTKV